MRKFSIDPSRLSRYREASASAYAAGREAQQDYLDRHHELGEIKAKKRLIDQGMEIPAYDRARLHGEADAKIESIGTEIQRLSEARARASELAQHHGAIAAAIDDYVGDKKQTFAHGGLGVVAR